MGAGAAVGVCVPGVALRLWATGDDRAGSVVQNMLAATYAGTKILFGELGLPNAGAFGQVLAQNGHPNAGSIFAFQVLPTIIFISAFFAVMYHIGVDADHHSRAGLGDAEDDAHLRRGEHECGGFDLHGADRSAADDPAVSQRSDTFRTDDDYDQRDTIVGKLAP